jgi:hypothetical protein
MSAREGPGAYDAGPEKQDSKQNKTARSESAAGTQANGTGAASPGQQNLARLRAWLERDEYELADIVERWDLEREHREAACSRWELVLCVRALQATICARVPAPPVETNAEGLFLQLIHEVSIDQSKLRPDQTERLWRLQDQCADAIAKNQFERVYVDILDDVVGAIQTMDEYEEDIRAGMHGEQPDEEAEPVDKIKRAPDPAGPAAPDYEFDPIIDEFFYLRPGGANRSHRCAKVVASR